MALRVYNSLTQEKEVFKPLVDKEVKFYHCGPTVYWTQHIGNLRGMVLADLIRRSLLYLGYKVTLVRNYTDVGHLTSDEDVGEDKMEKGAKREGLSPREIAEKYIQIFEQDTQALNILEPEYKPKATDYIKEMIALVQILIDKGYAYVTPKAVYFDVSKFPNYTKLNRQNLEDLKQGAGKGEIEDQNKRSPLDFALWFFKTGVHKNAIQVWSSPFVSSEVSNGEGFPGWHIECSAMSKSLLGDTLDLHMGGIEHIPVHHTNEIAQSEAANGVKFVNYWLHNEHLTVNGRKMAKSEGTGYSLQQVLEKGFQPLDLRYFFLNSHYRSKQNFTWGALDAAKNAMNNLKEKIRELPEQEGEVIESYRRRFIEALEDDFNIPQSLAVMWELLKSTEKKEDILATVYNFDRVFGLELDEISARVIESLTTKDQKVYQFAKERDKARSEKNWKKSDELRDKITQLGWQVEDTKEGTKVYKKQ